MFGNDALRSDQIAGDVASIQLSPVVTGTNSSSGGELTTVVVQATVFGELGG